MRFSRVIIGVVVLLLCLVWVWRYGSRSIPEQATPPVEIEESRTSLLLKDGRLYHGGQTLDPFTGWMKDAYADGALRSRSFVSNGVLEGISLGYYTNGVLQVEEHFVEGVSHGMRRKWHPNGELESEAAIVRGELHGIYRSWDEQGRLRNEVEMKRGQPDGLSIAYFPSGFIKARVLMRQGQVIERDTFLEEERKTAP